MSKPRNSPKQNAAEIPLGTIMKGDDDNIYVTKGRSNGTKFWKKTILGDKNLPKTWPGSNNVIRVGEIISKAFASSKYSVTLNVDDEFLEVLQKKPIYKKSNIGNAYIFGNFAKDDWIYVGEHVNDAAQTGIILSMVPKKFYFPKQDVDKINKSKSWNTIYEKVSYKWGDRKSLISTQTQISPQILFLGETVGGDIGAKVYIHITNKKIDGLIIDNNYVI